MRHVLGPQGCRKGESGRGWGSVIASNFFWKGEGGGGRNILYISYIKC